MREKCEYDIGEIKPKIRSVSDIESAITLQFCRSQFVEEYDPTLEDSERREWSLDGERLTVDILDTAGNPEYYRPEWLRQGQGYLVVFSVLSRDSFDHALKLIAEIRDSQIAYPSSRRKAAVVLVGNACEQRQEDREVNAVEAKDASILHKVPYLETSARDRINVDEAFATLVREIRRLDIMVHDHTKQGSSKGCCGCVVM